MLRSQDEFSQNVPPVLQGSDKILVNKTQDIARPYQSTMAPQLSSQVLPEGESSSSAGNSISNVTSIDKSIDNEVLEEDIKLITPMEFRTSGFLPELTSTPVGIRSEPRNQLRLRDPFHETELPGLVLDNIFKFLSAQDVRVVHQVSQSWKSMVESRVGDNSRRLELVRNIRKNKIWERKKLRWNKENIMKESKMSTSDLHPVGGDRRSDQDTEDVILKDCTNFIQIRDASSINNTTTVNLKPLLKPSSPFFQSFDEIQRKTSQELSMSPSRRCSCSSSLGAGCSEESIDIETKIEATRSKLMQIPSRPDRKLRDRKKSRTATYRTITKFGQGSLLESTKNNSTSCPKLIHSLSLTDINNSSLFNTSDYFSSDEFGYFIEDRGQSNSPGIVGRSFDSFTDFKTKSLGSMTIERDSSDFWSETSLESLSCDLPNSSASFALCSICSMAQHDSRPCRIIDSESFEDVNKRNVISCSPNIKSQIIHERVIKSKRSTDSCSKNKTSRNSLRRLAKL